MDSRLRLDERGVTLMEIIVSVALISILVTIAIPQIKSALQDEHLKATARELYAYFQRAKVEAIKRNETVLITFDVQAGRYQMFVDTLPPNANNRMLDIGEEILATQNLPQGVEFVSVTFGGTTSGGFLPNGRPSGGTGHVVIRNPETGKEFRLTTSIAGYVHLK